MNPLSLHPESMPWQDDPYGLLHRLFWNESPLDPDEGIFRIYGVVHLYASSGIHLYAFLQTLQSATFPLVQRFELDLRVVKRVVTVVAIALLLWAWSLQSFRPGFARPLVTFFIRWWGRHQGAKFRILAPLLVTLIFDFVFDFGWGRSHYYLAIAGGLFALEQMEKNRKGRPPSVLQTHLALSVGSWVLTAPLDLVIHHRISWMTPIYSLVTLPPLSHFLYPASLLDLFFSGGIHPVLLAGWSLLMEGIVWLAEWTPGPIEVKPAALALGLGFAGIAMWKRSLLTILVLASVGLRFLLPEPATLTQLDVKQGDALLIRTPGRVEMIDVGPERSLRSGAWVDRSFFYSVTEIDAILLTHLDADHVGGLRRLLPWIKVKCIQSHRAHWQSDKGKALRQWLTEVHPEIKIAEEGCFQSGTLSWFKSESKKRSGNDLMAGVWVPLSSDRVYLAVGDGDQSQERKYWKAFAPMISLYPERIWKISHHGSRFSTDPQVLKKIHPEEVWISVGRKNSYRHPSPSTLQRLASMKAGFNLQRTDVAGDLTEKISQPSRLRILE